MEGTGKDSVDNHDQFFEETRMTTEYTNTESKDRTFSPNRFRVRDMSP